MTSKKLRLWYQRLFSFHPFRRRFAWWVVIHRRLGNSRMWWHWSRHVWERYHLGRLRRHEERLWGDHHRWLRWPDGHQVGAGDLWRHLRDLWWAYWLRRWSNLGTFCNNIKFNSNLLLLLIYAFKFIKQSKLKEPKKWFFENISFCVTDWYQEQFNVLPKAWITTKVFILGDLVFTKFVSHKSSLTNRSWLKIVPCNQPSNCVTKPERFDWQRKHISNLSRRFRHWRLRHLRRALPELWPNAFLRVVGDQALSTMDLLNLWMIVKVLM